MQGILHKHKPEFETGTSDKEGKLCPDTDSRVQGSDVRKETIARREVTYSIANSEVLQTLFFWHDFMHTQASSMCYGH